MVVDKHEVVPEVGVQREQRQGLFVLLLCEEVVIEEPRRSLHVHCGLHVVDAFLIEGERDNLVGSVGFLDRPDGGPQE